MERLREEARSDDDPDGGFRAAAGRRSVAGLSSPDASPAERKGFSLQATRPVSGGTDAERRNPSKRPATLRCVRSGGPGPNAAGRASATEGSQTSGGAVAVRFVDADSCGALGCRRSDQLVAVELDGDRRVLCLPHARRWVR